MRRSFSIFITIIFMISSGMLVYFAPLYAADQVITDSLYTHFSGTDRRIVIIGIDEETLNEYGNFSLWSREKLSDLLEKLYEVQSDSPAVVGLDFIMTDLTDPDKDKRLADAAKKADGNIVVGSNIVYRGRVEKNSAGEMFYNTEHIYRIEMPYNELREAVIPGFTNKIIASDGYIRYAVNSVTFTEDETVMNHDSFAFAVYKLYCAKTGEKIRIPATNSRGQFQFAYSGTTGEFSELSLSAVLSGKVPTSAFRDAIVLVGAYAPGFQDAYQPASDRGDSMYGVEIHANLIQAYMQGKTMIVANRLVIAVITALLVFGLMTAGRKAKLPKYAAGSAVFTVLYLITGMILAANGIVIPCIYIIIMVLASDIYFLFDNHQRELKKQMWSFTEAMAAAIDERTPYNASHTRNVAKYCGMVADHINKLHRRGKEKEHFSEHRKEQLVMGALLHDIGKIAVPLSVMNKATRLGGREDDIKKRLLTVRLRAEIMMLRGDHDEAWYEDIRNKTEHAELMIDKANAAGYLNDELMEEVSVVLKYEFEGEPFFTDSEKECLSIRKGTLTDSERKVMESHVSITKNILSKVYFNSYFRNSPVYAGQHHENLDGSGYPDGIKAEELSSESRIMTVCDICDALLATDRPYKKPLPFEKAFAIMRDMVGKGTIDGKYVEYLYECLKPHEGSSE
ncbi:MAG: CHASE2 domain-containing protein [Ruminiclostridium sp.]|nr:CHASE2 domain-containing protein [Ruminiclostridium sp.]